MKIFFDMDEVFTDFIGGACKVHSVCPEEVHAYRTENQVWEMTKAIASIKGSHRMTLDEFWGPIHLQGANFWASLQPTPWALRLYEVMLDLKQPWFIVTTGDGTECSHRGKMNWLKSFFGRDFDRFFITQYKWVFANHDSLLIDDKPSNIKSFSEHGGATYLFPSSPLSPKQDLVNPIEDLVSFFKSMEIL